MTLRELHHDATQERIELIQALKADRRIRREVDRQVTFQRRTIRKSIQRLGFRP